MSVGHRIRRARQEYEPVRGGDIPEGADAVHLEIWQGAGHARGEAPERGAVGGRDGERQGIRPRRPHASSNSAPPASWAPDNAAIIHRLIEFLFHSKVASWPPERKIENRQPGNAGGIPLPGCQLSVVGFALASTWHSEQEAAGPVSPKGPCGHGHLYRRKRAGRGMDGIAGTLILRISRSGVS